VDSEEWIVDSEKKKAPDCRDLLVWQKAFGLVKQVSVLTGEFPAHEKYGLVPQMRYPLHKRDMLAGREELQPPTKWKNDTASRYLLTLTTLKSA
jgi:23S rRNA-intervening sequence protein